MRPTHHKSSRQDTQHNTAAAPAVALLAVVGMSGTRWHQTPFVKTLFYCLLALRGQRQRPTVRQRRNVVDNWVYVLHSAYMCHAFYGAIALINNKAQFDLRVTLTCFCAAEPLPSKYTSESRRAKRNYIYCILTQIAREFRESVSRRTLAPLGIRINLT